MTAPVATAARRDRAVRLALGLLGLRLALVALATVAMWGVLAVLAGGIPFPPGPMFASLGLLPVNILCLVVAARLLRRDGQTVRSMFAPTRRFWLAETAWGLLWLAVLYVPFALAIVATMWMLYGDGLFDAFATVFYDPDSAPAIPVGLSLGLGIVTFATFAVLNAPTEELVYRGFAQSRLSRGLPVGVAIVVSAVAFGLQHAFFAPTVQAMIVYVVAFTVWGIGSGLIVRWQKRLLPITISHLIVNLATSAPAVIFPILQVAGVLPAAG